MIGRDSLVADLARAGAAPAVRLSALAGDFTVWTYGDPARLAGVAPPWIADAAAVGAYDIEADRAAMIAGLGMPAPRPTPVPPSYNPAPPTTRQRAVLAAIRRCVQLGDLTRVTFERVQLETCIDGPTLLDHVIALEGRGLVQRLAPAHRVHQTLLVLGPRAYLYPERFIDDRTARSRRIEELLIEGKTIKEVVAAMAAENVTRAEVVRVRGLCGSRIPRRTTRALGENHARVIALRLAEPNIPQAEIGRRLGISDPRVSQIIRNAIRLGDI